jgi:hypothetical protein
MRRIGLSKKGCVYVIHKDGERWDKKGRKIAYLKLGAAKSVVTSECNDFAYDAVYHLDCCAPERADEFKSAFDEEYKRYEIVEYVPKT